MKKFRNLKQKIIFYVMSVSILLTVLITAVMSFGSIRSTNKLQLDNIQVTTRIASQSISSNLHLLTERIYNISTDAELTDDSLSKKDKAAYLQDFEQEIEFVWLSVYDADGKKLYGDKTAPDSIADTKYYSQLAETANTVIGEPHYDQDVLQLCVGAPLKANDEICGYVIGSYKYDLLNDVLIPEVHVSLMKKVRSSLIRTKKILQIRSAFMIRILPLKIKRFMTVFYPIRPVPLP